MTKVSAIGHFEKTENKYVNWDYFSKLCQGI